MTNLQNFRLKIDLSKFYSDERKLSYIYVDTSKIVSLSQLHKKISSLFDINRHFYLVTEDNVFLPLNEDIRIIDQHDVIRAQPAPEVNEVVEVERSQPKLKLNGDVQIIEAQVATSKNKKKSPIQCKTQTDSTSNDTDDETQTDSKIEKKDNNCSIDFSETLESTDILQKKRKRIRRRRPKKTATEFSPNLSANTSLQNGHSTAVNGTTVKIYSNKTSTPQVAPKHWKFTWDDETNGQKDADGNVVAKHQKPIIRSDEIADLSALLGLKNRKNPVKFSSKRAKTELLMSREDNDNGVVEIYSNSTKNNSTVKSESSMMDCTETEVDVVDYSKVDPLIYPTHNSEFNKEDIVAFRTLKIGDDYSPTVSGYIIAKTLSKDGDRNEYTFQILEGHDQVKIPDGKFSLPTEEEEGEEENGKEDKKLDKCELVTLAASHLVEPRLIYRSKVS